MKKSKVFVMMATVIIAAVLTTACSVEDNSSNANQSEVTVMPTAPKQIIGGWSETERRKVNADGSLKAPVDWTMMDGGEAYNIEITADSIYFFLGNYTYTDGYLAYHYTYDAVEQNLHLNGYGTIRILDLSDNSLKVLQEGYQIIYKRMSDDSLKWYWEHFSKNLKDL